MGGGLYIQCFTKCQRCGPFSSVKPSEPHRDGQSCSPPEELWKFNLFSISSSHGVWQLPGLHNGLNIAEHNNLNCKHAHLQLVANHVYLDQFPTKPGFLPITIRGGIVICCYFVDNAQQGWMNIFKLWKLITTPNYNEPVPRLSLCNTYVVYLPYFLLKNLQWKQQDYPHKNGKFLKRH